MACHLKVFSFIGDLKTISSSLGLCSSFSTDTGKVTDNEIDGWNNNSEVPETNELKGMLVSWPQSCFISVSPFADAMVLCNSRKAIFLKSKWESIENEEKLMFFTSAEKTVIHSEGEKICSVLCLPLASQRRFHQIGPDWTSVIIGFSTGIIRIYTEDGELLLSQTIFDAQINRLRYMVYPSNDNAGDLIIMGSNIVAAIDGFVLWQTVKACRNHLARVKAGQDEQITQDPLYCKRWILSDVTGLSDCCFVGHTVVSMFDYLVAQSMQIGPSAYPRSSLPSVSVMLSTGENLFLGLYHVMDTRSPQALSDVAAAFATKLKTFMPSTGLISGLLGRKETVEPTTVSEPPTALTLRFGLFDKHRQGTQLYLSPDNKLAALTDTFGRVSLVDVNKGLCIKMFKGYRDAQCGWLEVEEEPEQANSKHYTSSLCKIFYLVIYAPKRGILEVWLAQLGKRVAAFNVSKSARLIYSGKCIMGLNGVQQNKHIGDVFPCCLLEPNGNLTIISITFKSALQNSSSPEQLDTQLLREVRECLKGKCRDEILNQVTELKQLIQDMQSLDSLKQTLQLLIESNSLSADAVVDCVSSIRSRLKALEEEYDELPENNSLQNACNRINQLCRTFSAFSVLNMKLFEIQEESNHPADVQNLAQIFYMREKECAQLLSITSLHSGMTVKQKRVSFAEEESISTLGTFLRYFKIFDETTGKKLDLPVTVMCKDKCSDSYSANIGTFLFQTCLKNPLALKEVQDILKDSGMLPEELILLLLCHWLKVYRTVPHWSRWINLHNVLCFCFTITDLTNSLWLTPLIMLLSNSGNLGSAYIACALIRTLANSNNKETIEEYKTECNLINSDNENNGHWEKFSKEYVTCSILLKRLEDLMIIDALLRSRGTVQSASKHTIAITLSVDGILQKGPGSISEVVAEWAVCYHVSPDFFVQTFPSNTPDNKIAETQYDSAKGLFEQARKQFPRSLDSDSLLANICWEYMVHWKKEPDEVRYLVQALNHFRNVSSVILRNGIGCMLWKTFVLPRFEVLALLMEKVGKTPKERLCKQEIGMSTIHLEAFLEFCCEFLDVMMEANMVSEGHESLTPFPPDDLWKLEDSYTVSAPLVMLACHKGPSSYAVIYHHYLLANAMLFVAAFQLKNLRPMSVYDTRGRQAFFQDLQMESSIPVASLPYNIVSLRIQFLQRVASGIATSIPDTVPSRGTKTCSTSCASPLSNSASNNAQSDASRWINRVFALAKGWDISRDQIAQFYVCDLYSSGHDNLAEEALTSVSDATKLGVNLLLIAGQRVAHLVLTSSDQAGTLSQFPPALTSWLKNLNSSSLKCCNNSLLDTKVLVSHAVNMIPEYENEHSLAVSLLDAIVNMLS